MTEKLLTTAQVAAQLGLTEPEVEQLVLEGRLAAYRLGGKYLRFRPEQVERLQGRGTGPSAPARSVVSATPSSDTRTLPYTWGERLRDFIYFNDFYLMSVALFLLVLYAIFRW